MAFFSRYARTDSAAPHSLDSLSVDAHSHIGEALGIIAAKRRIRLRIVRYSRRRTATSASWDVMYRAWRTTFAPIWPSLTRSAVSVQCLTLRGNARRRIHFVAGDETDADLTALQPAPRRGHDHLE
jgi:hypothetical protein